MLNNGNMCLVFVVLIADTDLIAVDLVVVAVVVSSPCCLQAHHLCLKGKNVCELKFDSVRSLGLPSIG